MSTQSGQFKIIRDNDTKTFDDEEQFNQTVDLLEQNGVDFETEKPGSEEGDSLDAEVVDHTEEQPTDEEVLDETIEPKADGSGEPTEAEIVQEQPDKPDRNLSDDPVQWIEDAGNFTYQKNGKTAINKKGLRVLQHWYEINNPESEVIVGPEETEHEYCRVRAKAEMPDGRTAVAHGSAHIGRGDDSHLLVEMADTRAKSRVLLDITGMGAVAVSELQNEL